MEEGKGLANLAHGQDDLSRTNGYYVFAIFTRIYIELELAGEREWPVVCDTLIRLHLFSHPMLPLQ